MKTIAILALAATLAACAPRMNLIEDKPMAGTNASDEFAWSGCRFVDGSKVEEDGSVQFFPFGLYNPGVSCFKQKNADGTVSESHGEPILD